MKSISNVILVCLATLFSLPVLSQTNVTSVTGGSNPWGQLLKFTSQYNAEKSIVSEIGGDSIFVNNGTSQMDSNCDYSSILGGNNNDMTVNSDYSTIAGGVNNTLYDSDYCTVAGGVDNDMTYASYSFIGGGQNNTMGYAYWSVVGGGYNNDIPDSAHYSTITGGRDNDVLYSYTTVGGGRLNYAYGEYATVPGGYYNWAVGDKSFAAGSLATATHDGAFVWADSDSTCASSATDQFKVCADGGMIFDLDGAQVNVDGTVRADDFIEYSPYPEDLEEAYASVMSVQRLPDGEYNPDDIRSQMDHSTLHSFIRRDGPEGPGCSLSALVSSQNEVIKDLIDKIYQLQSQLGRLEEALAER